jgi:hypothetical protein
MSSRSDTTQPADRADRYGAVCPKLFCISRLKNIDPPLQSMELSADSLVSIRIAQAGQLEGPAAEMTAETAHGVS